MSRTLTRWTGLLGITAFVVVPGTAALDPPPDECAHPDIRSELLERVEKDQAARRAVQAPDNSDRQRVIEAVGEIDECNTSWMKSVVERTGWPTRSAVGADGAHAAWLLVQHADRDPAFQSLCLDLMEGFGEDEVSPIDVAYLTDRVRVNHGELQVYGTQFHEVDGLLQPRPIENADQVDQRRLSVGLPTLAEYRRMMAACTGQPVADDEKPAADSGASKTGIHPCQKAKVADPCARTRPEEDTGARHPPVKSN